MTDQVPQVRRRVRTGCLTCRGRRRKCDETKPVCNNCKAKNLVCRYGLNVTFVGGHTVSSEERSRGQRYSNIRFVEDPSSRQANSPARSEPSPASEASIRESSQQINFFSPDASGSQTDYISQESSIEAVPNAPSIPSAASIPNSTPILIHPGNNSIPDNAGNPPIQPLDRSLDRSLEMSWLGHTEPESHPTHSTWTPDLQNAMETEPLAVHSNSSHSHETSLDVDQDQYQVELLSYYRYRIAPLLDLGVGTLHFGIQAMVASRTSPPVYFGALSLASCQRSILDGQQRSQDEKTSISSARNAMQNVHLATQEDKVLTFILLAWRNMLLYPCDEWYRKLHELALHFDFTDGITQEEHHQVLLRLSMASVLMDLGLSDSSELSFAPRTRVFLLPGQCMSAKQQLQQSLLLLERSMVFTPGGRRGRLSMHLPIASAWQSCWSDNQIWYVTRNEETTQVFELDNTEMSRFEVKDETSFPVVMFSNACATVANIVHHLTAMILLQHKPRLIKPVVESTSSSSLIWHAQRLVGIAATCEHDMIWDPLVMAAVYCAARWLSHDKQLSVVIELLRKASIITGMKFNQQIEKLEDNRIMTGSS